MPGWPHCPLNMEQSEGRLCPRVRWGLQNLLSGLPVKDEKPGWSQGSFVGPEPPHLCSQTPLLGQHGDCWRHSLEMGSCTEAFSQTKSVGCLQMKARAPGSAGRCFEVTEMHALDFRSSGRFPANTALLSTASPWVCQTPF